MQIRFSVIYVVLAVACCRCHSKSDILFTKISPVHSQINFENTIKETPEINILTYEYAYNGGGVATGDFNNDGLCDLYFSGNTVSNKLYLNLGDFKFNDVTDQAGVGGRKLWKTGVTAVDVNADGWLDLYVCYSGPDLKQSFSNQLFISNGIKDGQLSFTDRAEEYGLDAPGTFSTQAAFFDYDLDGDLDMFLVNHGNHFYSPFANTNKLRNTRHPQFGNRLYRNELINQTGIPETSFTEVSTEAGIHGGGLNFGLGVSISDLNNDGWPDVYVTNDYEEQDFLYINNQNGTFTECAKKAFGHFSRNGMGTDIADYNNDGKPDLVEVDMWPEDNYRQKLLKGPDDYNRYQLMLDSGFHHQQMRNTLQLNEGINDKGIPVFSEIGQLAGVHATDWSWAPLFADVDNDGFKDLFITNGYLRDFTSMDFLKFTVEEARVEANRSGKELKVFELVSKMAATKTQDYIFRNNANLTFSDKTSAWGLATPNLSFGAAYADLDNDGDLELITNNTNEPASIWKNNSDHMLHNNYLKVQLVGLAGNSFGIGAKVFLQTENQTQLIEQYPTRGFQSSVDPVLHFGLGNNITAKQVKVIWLNGYQSVMNSVQANQKIIFNQKDAQPVVAPAGNNQPALFEEYTTASGIVFTHFENPFVDYNRESLIPYQVSRTGPALAVADVNGDGADDFFIGGAIGQSGKLFLGSNNSHFVESVSQPWQFDKLMEDVSAIFFDAEGDGDQDLFIVSGGNEYSTGSEFLDDRLYINTGKGEFIKAPLGSIVADHANGTCVTTADYDKDGDLDLFVGGGSQPGNFPLASPGAILRNESNKITGEIKFVVVTKDVNPDLREPGIVTDALWADINNDTWPDLILVGEWMPIRIFENQKGKLIEVKNEILQQSNGLWCRVVAADLDKDGDLDFVIGNAGINLPWRISMEQPLSLYYHDFNSDGTTDPILFYSLQDKQFPIASRDELLRQLPALRKKFTSYAAYGKATLTDILDKEQLSNARRVSVTTLYSVVLENLGNFNFTVTPLPLKAQVSSVRGIVIDDFNKDGFADILLAGNFYSFHPQFGPSDASNGLFLAGSATKTFIPMDWDLTGFYAPGDIRNMKLLKAASGSTFIIQAKNNESISVFKFFKNDKNDLTTGN